MGVPGHPCPVPSGALRAVRESGDALTSDEVSGGAMDRDDVALASPLVKRARRAKAVRFRS